jgi:hypothetical protein
VEEALKALAKVMKRAPLWGSARSLFRRPDALFGTVEEG